MMLACIALGRLRHNSQALRKNLPNSLATFVLNDSALGKRIELCNKNVASGDEMTKSV